MKVVLSWPDAPEGISSSAMVLKTFQHLAACERPLWLGNQVMIWTYFVGRNIRELGYARLSTGPGAASSTCHCENG